MKIVVLNNNQYSLVTARIFIAKYFKISNKFFFVLVK